MHLQLEDLLERTGITDKAFFEMAHKVVMGFEKDITQELLCYQVGGIVPPWVEQFVYLKER